MSKYIRDEPVYVLVSDTGGISTMSSSPTPTISSNITTDMTGSTTDSTTVVSSTTVNTTLTPGTVETTNNGIRHTLTHISLVSLLLDLGKQYRHRAASDQGLHSLLTGISIRNKIKMKKYTTHP